MKRLLLCASLFACLLTLSSCKDDNRILYAIQTMATADQGRLKTEWGEVMNVLNPPLDYDLSSGRFMVSGYIVEDHGNDEYDLSLYFIEKALCKERLKNSEIVVEETGIDAVRPISLWAGKDYLNMQLGYYYQTGEGHSFDLVYDDLKSNPDTLYFDIRHNARKDTYGYEEVDEEKLKIGTFYASFFINDLIPKDKQTTVITLRNVWYKTDDAQILPETHTEQNSITYRAY